MRLASYENHGTPGLAAAGKDGDFHGLTTDQPGYPGDLERLLAEGADLADVGRKLQAAPRVDLAKVRLKPPLSHPGKIVCLGLNYQTHSAEFGLKIPAFPELFARFPSSLVGHGSPIIRPRISEKLDYEGELAVIIGRGGRHIPRETALAHVAGYAVFNDASVRDVQFRGSQWLPGKNFDQTGAFGPWLVTADALPPGAKGLRLTTRLNGVVTQDASTGDMIFDVAAQIALVSEIMTLSPGDVFITGTPGGVGQSRTPKLFMKPGDVCEVEIEAIGVLRNPVALEEIF